MFRTLVAVFTALSLVACTSMRPLPANDPSSVRQAVKVGDDVSVVATNGKTYLLTLTAVDDEKLVGVGDNKKVTIRYAQIVSMEVRKVSAAKTAGLTVGVLAVVYITLIALGAYAFSKAFENSN